MKNKQLNITIKLFLTLLLIVSLLFLTSCQTPEVEDNIEDSFTEEITIETEEDASESIIGVSEDLSNIADELEDLNNLLGE